MLSERAPTPPRYELATNAAKYGALSVEEGRLEIRWNVTVQKDARMFSLQWSESGGPEVKPPTRRGFGARAVERMLATTIEGQVHLAFDAEGLRCVIDAPFSRNLGSPR